MSSTSDIQPNEPAGFNVAAAYVLQLIEVVGHFGVTPTQLLAGFGLSEDVLGVPGEVVSIKTFGQLVERARTLTGEPGLGFHMGINERASAHGFLSFAMMTAATLGEALELAVQFSRTRSNSVALRLESNGKKAILVVEERVSLGAARDAIIMSLLTGFWKIGNAITGRELAGDVDYAFVRPRYFDRFATWFPGKVRFAQPSNRLVFDASLLETPLAMADPIAMRAAREQCERELRALGEPRSFVARVRAAMFVRGPEKLGSVDDVASSLAMSSRTLKRKLE
jgi:hypothetical protein